MVDVREALSDVPSGLPDLEEIPSTEDGEIVVVGNPRMEPSEVSHTGDKYQFTDQVNVE